MSEEQKNAVLDWMRQQGAPAHLLKEAESGYLRQADYTKKRQEESAELNTARQQMAYLMGKLGVDGNTDQGGSGDPVEDFLSGHIDMEDDGQRALHGLLSGLMEAAEKRFTGKVAQSFQPVASTVMESRAEKMLDSYIKEQIEPRFGKKGAELIDAEMRAEMLQSLMKGEKIVPEVILMDKRPDDALAAMADAQRAKRNNESSKHLEGLSMHTTTDPPMAGGGGEYDRHKPDAEPQGRLTVQQQYARVNDEDITRSVLREMMEA